MSKPGEEKKEAKKPGEEKREEAVEETTEEKVVRRPILGPGIRQMARVATTRKLEKLLAEEPTEKRTLYMIDTEIKTEAQKLQEAGKLTSELLNKIHERGIGI